MPVIPPIGIDGAGASYRLNSDAVAVEVAKSLRAVKLVYLNTEGGVCDPKGVVRQMTVQEAENFLKKHRGDMTPEATTKLTHAVRAAKEGVERIHIIDGREQEGLLGEVFSNEGIGTLVYANEYQAIRAAQKKDVRAVHSLIQQGVQNDELVKRTRSELEKIIGDYFVFEVDRNPVACVALHMYPDQNMAEVASVFVDERYENQGIGTKLIRYAEEEARRRGLAKIFCAVHAGNRLLRAERLRARQPRRPPATASREIRTARPQIAGVGQAFGVGFQGLKPHFRAGVSSAGRPVGVRTVEFLLDVQRRGPAAADKSGVSTPGSLDARVVII